MQTIARSLVALLVGLALVGPARADEEVKAMYARAQALYALQRFDEAAPLFEKAFEKLPDPALLYNAAQAHRFAGNKDRALRLYESYVRLYGAQIPNRDEVVTLIASLRQAIESDKRAATAPPKDTHEAKDGKLPSIEPSPETPPPTVVTTAPVLVVEAPHEKPLVKKGWFWGVIAGSAAVVVVGVTLGVVFGTASKNPAITFGTVNGN